jgi:Spy/CpxP family protein refolding chaperone
MILNPALPPSLPRSARRLAAASVLGLVALGAAGCNARSGEPVQASAETAAAEPAAAVRSTSLRGAISSSLAEIQVRPEQQAAVDRLRASLGTKPAAVRAAHEKLGNALTDAVLAGKVDAARMAPLIDGLAAAVDAAKPIFQAEANELHATLDAAQRTALIQATRAHFKGMWHHAEKRGEDSMIGPVGEIARKLALTDDQIETIRAAAKSAMGESFHAKREERQQMRAHLDAIGEAFESETFDAKALDVGADGAEMARERVERVVTLVGIALPVLTADQRAKLAEHIQDHVAAD